MLGEDQTTQALAVIEAHTLLNNLVSCPKMDEHFIEKGAGAEDLKLLQTLLDDETLVFFSIKRVIDRQVYKTSKAKQYIPDDN